MVNDVTNTIGDSNAQKLQGQMLRWLTGTEALRVWDEAPAAMLEKAAAVNRPSVLPIDAGAACMGVSADWDLMWVAGLDEDCCNTIESCNTILMS